MYVAVLTSFYCVLANALSRLPRALRGNVETTQKLDYFLFGSLFETVCPNFSSHISRLDFIRE